MTPDIETSRNNGALQTTTQGAQMGGGGGSYPSISGFLSDALARKNKLAQSDFDAEMARRSFRPGLGMGESAGARRSAPESSGQYVPSLAAAPAGPSAKKQPTTRMRRVRTRNPIPVYGMDPAGFTYNDVQETLLDDGSWSGDALYGTNAGNEAAAMKGPVDITKLVGMNFSGLGGGTWGLPQKKES